MPPASCSIWPDLLNITQRKRKPPTTRASNLQGSLYIKAETGLHFAPGQFKAGGHHTDSAGSDWRCLALPDACSLLL